MLDDSEDDCWVFRRDTTIQMPLSLAIRRDAQGIPFLAPEIQILYKARSVRTKDQADFDHVGPRLDSVARAWLGNALNRIDPYLDPLAVTVFDAAHSQEEQRWFTLGTSSEGKLLAVAHTYQDSGVAPVKARIISARPATRRERQQYENEPQ